MNSLLNDWLRNVWLRWIFIAKLLENLPVTLVLFQSWQADPFEFDPMVLICLGLIVQLHIVHLLSWSHGLSLVLGIHWREFPYFCTDLWVPKPIIGVLWVRRGLHTLLCRAGELWVSHTFGNDMVDLYLVVQQGMSIICFKRGQIYTGQSIRMQKLRWGEVGSSQSWLSCCSQGFP